MKTALVILAQGAEEIETSVIVDVLRRGGVKVTLAGLDGADSVLCSRDMKFLPDIALSDCLNVTYDAILLPGGSEGSKRLSESDVVETLIKKQLESKTGIVGAICAAPTALTKRGIAKDRNITAYPSLKGEITKAGYKYQDKTIVQDGNLITSQGPGTAFAFAIKLVEVLVDQEKAQTVQKGLLL